MRLMAVLLYTLSCLFAVMALSNETEGTANTQVLQRTTSKTSVHLCGSKHGIFKIDYIKLNPNPPIKGQMLNIEFSGYLEEEVPRYSYIDLSVKLGFFEVIHTKIDLCSEALIHGPSCPVTIGPYHYSTNIMVPFTIPNGDYSVNANIVTPQGVRITCLIVDASL
ncbi:ML domain-containing protein [Parasitella parasitica]|nr:ML domain-containing protein [Parasitella parasitica]